MVPQPPGFGWPPAAAGLGGLGRSPNSFVGKECAYRLDVVVRTLAVLLLETHVYPNVVSRPKGSTSPPNRFMKLVPVHVSARFLPKPVVDRRNLHRISG